MKLENLRSLIRESVQEYIKEIDQAANEAAMDARITKCEEAINMRESKLEKLRTLEEVSDVLDEAKVKNIEKEINELKKAKAKFEKQKEKMLNKGKKKEVVADTETEAAVEEADVTAEMDLEEGASVGDEFGGNKVPKKFQDTDSADWSEKLKTSKDKFKDKSSKGYFELDEEEELKEDDIAKVAKLKGNANWNDKQRGLSWNSDYLYDDAQLEEGKTINESFLKMQKLAGLIK